MHANSVLFCAYRQKLDWVTQTGRSRAVVQRVSRQKKTSAVADFNRSDGGQPETGY